MADTQTLQVQTHAHGAVPEDATDLAVMRVRSELRKAHEPVLFARVKLTLSADPAVERPAIAQVNVDLNGRPIRAQANAATMRDAIEMLSDKLRIQLRRAERNWAAIHGGLPAREPEPGEWRHQSIPAQRLPYFPRPVDERSVVRHKSYGLAKLTPDEAVADLELLDYDFHLFTERSTNEDSVIYRADDGYRLAQVHPRPSRLGPTENPMTVSDVPAPRIDVADAETRLGAFGQPFMFFVNSRTGRGNLIYHRYDGDYGLITPADS
ncbi:MAG TPA: HPF/RaiA family ribosome-associated protein [Streptosporangiaceae bacterium]|nr:HPF/RaiA family ribosome-associated protein [Streptosporangiaceae bacterium]